MLPSEFSGNTRNCTNTTVEFDFMFPASSPNNMEEHRNQAFRQLAPHFLAADRSHPPIDICALAGKN
jgi:hypothetical protein